MDIAIDETSSRISCKVYLGTYTVFGLLDVSDPYRLSPLIESQICWLLVGVEVLSQDVCDLGQCHQRVVVLSFR